VELLTIGAAMTVLASSSRALEMAGKEYFILLRILWKLISIRSGKVSYWRWWLRGVAAVIIIPNGRFALAYIM
jgi:hypothetical protein